MELAELTNAATQERGQDKGNEGGVDRPDGGEKEACTPTDAPPDPLRVEGTARDDE